MKPGNVLAALLLVALIAVPVSAAPPTQGGGQEYVVQEGDWLSKIAERYHGDMTAYPAIVEATNAKAKEDGSFATITDPYLIEVGQKLWIPDVPSKNGSHTTETGMMAKTKTAAEAVPEVLQDYADALMAGDVDRWIQNWTEDGVQLPPGGPMVVGRQMIYESMRAWFDSYAVSDFRWIGDIDVREMGDWAFSVCSGTYTLTPRDGSPPFAPELKALTIYQRQPDGAWKIHRDCFNSNVSP